MKASKQYFPVAPIFSVMLVKMALKFESGTEILSGMTSKLEINYIS